MQQTENKYAMAKKLYDMYEQRFYIVAQDILKEEALAERAVEIAINRLLCSFEVYSQMNSAEAREHAIHLIEQTSVELYQEHKGDAEEPKGFAGWLLMLRRQREERLAPACALLMHLSEQQAEQLLGELPRGYQEVLGYRYVKNMSVAETAAILGCSEMAVRRRDVVGRRLLLSIVGYVAGECYDKNAESMLGDEEYVYKAV